MLYTTKEDLLNDLKGIVDIQKSGTIKIIDKDTLRNKKIDTLVYNAVFNKETALKNMSRWLIRSCGNQLGVFSSSIQSLYEDMGKKQYKGFTVPAVNIRGLTYDVARSIFRAAKRIMWEHLSSRSQGQRSVTQTRDLQSMHRQFSQPLSRKDMKARYLFKETISRSTQNITKKTKTQKSIK